MEADLVGYARAGGDKAMNASKFILAVVACLVLCGCFPQYDHRFKEGDFVETVLDGKRGQVVNASENVLPIAVRLSAQAKPYAVVYFYEWELRPSTKP